MSHPLGWGLEDARLSRLRRLYHHVINGGLTAPWDDRTVGAPATAENIALEIRRLEREQTAQHQEHAVTEERLAAKAAAADLLVFEGPSLGQISRKERWRALFRTGRNILG